MAIFRVEEDGIIEEKVRRIGSCNKKDKREQAMTTLPAPVVMPCFRASSFYTQ
jgi:hypothetical protein